jgi:flavin-dependent dehydrogenase
MGLQSADTFDVAVVGAGPAGAATATHLARAGCYVVVLDRATFPRDKPCAEYLSPAAEPLLARLGALDEIERTLPGRLRGFRVYAPNGTSFQGDFAATRDASGTSRFEIGLTVPRLRLDAALVAAARRAGVDVREGWRLTQVEREAGSGYWTLRPADGGAPVRARLLVAADGSHSTVARRLGLHAPTRMRKVALVAHLRGIAGLSEYGEVHVAGRRYVGLAPLEPPDVGDLCNVALVVDERRDGRHIAQQRPQAFLLAALRTFPQLRGRLDQISVARATLTTSGMRVRARHMAGEALLLVGDAGGYYDPFTGEGIYRALRGAELAAEVAAPALAAGDLSARALARYATLQRQEFRGKRAIEAIIQSAVQVPPVMDHIARQMRARKQMADTVVAVTGDYLPASAVLRPGYLLRLLV